VKLSKTIAYPLASVGVVCAFWLVMVMATRSNHEKSDSPATDQASGPNQVQSAEMENGPKGSSGGAAAVNQQSSPVNPLARNDRRKQESPQPSSATTPTKSSGSVGGGWLGLALEEDESASFRYQGKHIQGLVVSDVYPGGPGEKADIKEDDLLMAINGRPVRNRADVVSILSKLAPGNRVPLEIFRESGPTTVNVRLATPPRGSGANQLAQVGRSDDSGFSQPISPATSFSQGSGGIFINGRQLTPNQIREIKSMYGVDPVPGRFWYDSRSGLYGYVGREALGYIRPGHNFGPMPSSASNGNTGVFINGRQLNKLEVAYLRLIFGVVYTGRWWLDGNTGNIGQEGNPMPIANIYAAIRQRQGAGQQGGNYSWRSGITGAYGGSSGGCSYVSIPGSGTVSSGCD
jgi:hypothetical protein